ncbi:nuclear transport factor 2 family protein [uncultured Jatrophihabitans sp.]|uniref:nuclear transport factor 2 family protein n=1 Tax=uncultured Jatrophihabitans sp. TaxID=1610747 RepID=UPI0035CB229C
MSAPAPLRAWHEVADSRDPTLLAGLLADHAVFRSPAVYQPQEGKEVTTVYLSAALVVLGPTLRYVGEWHNERSAVLEFEADLDGTFVQGVDMLRWGDDGRITEFTVMVRPLRGLQALIERMAAQLGATGA